jgi:hypothetical protein
MRMENHVDSHLDIIILIIINARMKMLKILITNDGAVLTNILVQR